MKRPRLTELPALLLRSYGQLFLCNNLKSGLLFFLAMTIASPVNGLTSLLAALAFIMPALWRTPQLPALRSGLFGVNGIIFGYSWILFPEVPIWARVLATISGSVLMSLALIPLSVYLQRRESRYSPFTVPSVLLVWTLIVVMGLFKVYDPKAMRGWHFYYAGEYGAAERVFTEIELPRPRAMAYRADGLGWCRFQLKDYYGAIERFTTAQELDPGFADPRDGLGWSWFKLNQFGKAGESFIQAVKHNPLLADSWDGLGWVNFYRGDYRTAQSCFLKAIVICPLLPDAYIGLGNLPRTLDFTAGPIGTVMNGIIPRSLWFITSFQVLAWLLFIAGIVVHSVQSGVLAVTGLAVNFLVIGAGLLPAEHLDINYYYNLVAILVALGGHYLVLTISGLMLIVAISTCFLICWGPLSSLLLQAGLPTFSLPFNLVMILAIIIVSMLGPRVGLRLVPLDVATTRPATVRRWFKRSLIAQRCWAKVAEEQARTGEKTT